MAKASKTMKSKLITSVVCIVVCALLTVGVWFLTANWTTVEAAITESQQIYTAEQLEAARIEAYNKALGDKAAYENTISAMQQQLENERIAADKRFNDMVNNYEFKIAQLKEELERVSEQSRFLESSIFSLANYITTGTASGEISLDALKLVKDIYSNMQSDMEADVKNWENKIAGVSDLTELRNSIAVCQANNDKYVQIKSQNELMYQYYQILVEDWLPYMISHKDLGYENWIAYLKTIMYDRGISEFRIAYVKDSVTYTEIFKEKLTQEEIDSTTSTSTVKYQDFIYLQLYLRTLYNEAVKANLTFDDYAITWVGHPYPTLITGNRKYLEAVANIETNTAKREELQSELEKALSDKLFYERMLEIAQVNLSGIKDKIADLEKQIAESSSV